MMRFSRFAALVCLYAVLTMTAPCMAQPGAEAADPRAGTVAAVLGSLHVERSSGSNTMQVGDGVLVGDRLRTRSGDRAKLVLSDDSVIDIGSASEVVLETRGIAPDSGQDETVVILVAGQMRAVAPPQSTRPRARFEVETPAAVAFRGADFFVSHDPTKEISRVVALAGPARVAGRAGFLGGPVELAQGGGTEVRKGRVPGPPADVGFDDLARIKQSTTVVGTGRRDGLDVLHPAARGQLLAAGDVPGTRGGRAASPLRLGPPQEALADRLSGDVRTNTEPLLEYERKPPGVPAATGVQVEF